GFDPGRRGHRGGRRLLRRGAAPLRRAVTMARAATIGMLIGALLVPAVPASAVAHVKWFSDFSFAEPPRSIGELMGPTFIALLLRSGVVVGALVPVERWLGERRWYTRVNDWLEGRADSSRLVMRVGAGMVLLLAWQADIVLIPDLPLPAPWVGWFQFLLVGL